MTQQLQEPDPLIGQTVAGKFKIVKLLGEGGMGCVYLAEQQLGTNTRKVALKTLHKHLSQDQHIKARFNQEAGTVAGLEHPNTIQLYDFGEMPDGTLYLVMEFVQGESVGSILEKSGRGMDPARVENIMRQVCGSLEEAHTKGIIHRDLKPDNVVLCERAGQKDWVEVLDFGIAKRSSEHDPNEMKLTQQGMVLGTPPYMSPEQFTGQPIDKRSDIYALGVMAYEMLTGRLPFVANTAWEWASKHMTEPPIPIEQQPLGPEVPDRMKNAIRRAMSKNRDERPATVSDFFAEFSGGGATHTAVINAAGAGPAPAPRAKTEMAQPAMMPGPAAGAVTPGPMPMSGGAPPAVVPAGPQHEAPKKGNTGLVIGLGVLAVVLLAGAGVGIAMSRKPKPVPTVATTDTAAESASSGPALETSASAATPDVPASVATTEPLTPAKIPPQTGGGGTKPTVPAKSIPTPSIKPQEPPKEPPKPAEPAICVRAREAAARNSPVAKQLAAQCTNQGGHL